MSRPYPENPFLREHWEPFRMEGDALDLIVEGEIPRELRGALYRNGPNQRFSPRGGIYHPFGGDGMIHAFFFENGRVDYRNRWVRTERFRREDAAGESLFGGFGVALLWCVTAILWYAPIVGYLMLASAWAPRGPFLWAVLPPVGLWIGERVVVGSEYIGDFIADRLFGLYRLLGTRAGSGMEEVEGIEQLRNVDLVGSLRDFYTAPELWLGLVAAAALLLGAMWVRRYRDETS